MAKPNAAAKAKGKRVVHQDYLARMTALLPRTAPPPEPPLVVVEPSNTLDTPEPSNTLDTPAPVLKGLPAVEPLFRTCERCLRKRPHGQEGPSKRLCPECWSRVNGAPVPIDVTPRNPYFRLRMSVEEAFLALRNGRYSAALHILERARTEHTPKAAKDSEL